MKKIVFFLMFLLSFNNIYSQWTDIAPKGNLKMHLYKHVQFLDSLNGFITGNKLSDLKPALLKTNDGGLSWNYVSEWGPEHVYFINQDTAVSLNNNFWRRTINGGVSFDSIGKVASNHVFHVKDKGQLAFFIPSDSGMLKSIDYGFSWYKVNDINMYNLQFVNNNIGFAHIMGGPYTLYKTIDKGDSWQILNSSFGTHIYQFINEDTAYALVKDNSTSLWHIERSVDGGITWNRHHNGLVEAAFNFHFASSQVGFAIFNYRDVYKTIDGGNSWHYQWSSPCNISYFQSFNNEVLFVALVGSNYQDCFYKTTNGGGSIVSIFDQNKENKEVPSFNIYPNPSNDLFSYNVKFIKSKVAKLNIYNSVGQIVYSQQVSKNTGEINISNLSKGVYIAELKTSSKTLRRKFVKN